MRLRLVALAAALLLLPVWAEQGGPVRAAEAGRPAAGDPVARLRSLAAETAGTDPAAVRRLEAEAGSAPEAVRPAAQALLAARYEEYLGEHGDAVDRNFPTTGEAPADFTSWTRPEFLRRIDGLYQAALAGRMALMRIPGDALPGAFPEPAEADAGLPTLLDRVAAWAVEFYTGLAAGAPAKAGTPAVGPDSPLLGSWEDFVAEVKRHDPADPSPGWKILRIHAWLLGAHSLDGDRDAFLGWELRRLRAVGGMTGWKEGVAGAWIRHLEQLLGDFPDVTALSAACADLSAAWERRGDFGKSLAAAELGAAAYPDSPGGRRCRERARRLAAHELALEPDPVMAPGEARLRVRYRNVGRAYYRIYPDRWVNQPEYHDIGFSAGGRRSVERLLARRPQAAGSLELPEPAAFDARRVTVELPSLRPGFYRVLISPEPDWKRSPHLEAGWFWVSRMTVVCTPRPDGAAGCVVDARTGEPLPGVSVRAVAVEGRESVRVLAAATTDSRGCFAVAGVRPGRKFHLLLRRGDEELTLAEALTTANAPAVPDWIEQTRFFPDRSRYRPGQAVRFRAVCLRRNRRTGAAETLAGRPVRVALLDGRGVAVDSRSEITDASGGFAGVFVLPTVGTAGPFQLACAAPNGRADLPTDVTPAVDAGDPAEAGTPEVRPGGTLEAAWEPGCPGGRALVEVFRDGGPVRSFWTKPRESAARVALPVGEELRGGFVLRLLQVCAGRLHFRDFSVRVPWADSPLALSVEAPAAGPPDGPAVIRLRVDGWESRGGQTVPSSAGQAGAAAVWWDASVDPAAAPAWRPLVFDPEPPAVPAPAFPDRPGQSVVCRGDGWLGQPSGGPFPGRAEYVRELQSRGLWSGATDAGRLTPDSPGRRGAEPRPAGQGSYVPDDSLSEGELLSPSSGRNPAGAAARPEPAAPEDPDSFFVPLLPLSPEGVVEVPLPSGRPAGPWKVSVLVYAADGRSAVLTLDVPLP